MDRENLSPLVTINYEAKRIPELQALHMLLDCLCLNTGKSSVNWHILTFLLKNVKICQ